MFSMTLIVAAPGHAQVCTQAGNAASYGASQRSETDMITAEGGWVSVYQMALGEKIGDEERAVIHEAFKFAYSNDLSPEEASKQFEDICRSEYGPHQQPEPTATEDPRHGLFDPVPEPTKTPDDPAGHGSTD